MRAVTVIPMAAALAALLLSCAPRDEAPVRNRWWHVYERGLQCAAAGDDAGAEAAFRQCLRLRQTDRRQARTYGMHFVQCFAHRELGAVLLRRGQLDAAERELRLSEEQEPSAKTTYLLGILAERRGAAAPAAPAPATTGRIELQRIEPVPQGLRVMGRLVAEAGAVLWYRIGAAAPVRLPTTAAGDFQAEVAAEAQLAWGDDAGPAEAAGVTVMAAAPPAPELVVDGPDTGQVVSGPQVWYRWRASAAAGLARLVVAADGAAPVLDTPVQGVGAGGMVRVPLTPGPLQLRFTITDGQGGEARQERVLTVADGPQQDRRLRAVTLAIPLLPSRTGALRPADDARLRSALIADGRFRFVDAQADELLTRELNLVEAGYVDRSTAAAAGRRLACRYVIAGTMNRSDREAECYLRLVHCDSGRVVASADAYSDSADADRLFQATAGRLRQAFPVVAGAVTADAGQLRLAGGRRSGAVALMRVHIFPEPPAAAAQPVAAMEIDDVLDDAAVGRLAQGNAERVGWGVSE